MPVLLVYCFLSAWHSAWYLECAQEIVVGWMGGWILTFPSASPHLGRKTREQSRREEQADLRKVQGTNRAALRIA